MVTQTSGDETTSSKAAPKKAPATASTTGRRGGGAPLARIVRFIREVVAELGKVIWPTRKELVTYTVVVIVFVTVIVAIVAGLDFGFARAALAVFGK